MAIGGGGFCVDDQTVETGWASPTPVIWQHGSIPFRQFTHIDVELADGRVFSLVSQFPDGSDLFGLYVVLVDAPSALREPADGGIYRIREIADFPIGPVNIKVVRRDGPHAVIEALLSFCAGAVRVLSAEVYETTNSEFVIVERDESVLTQLILLKD